MNPFLRLVALIILYLIALTSAASSAGSTPLHAAPAVTTFTVNSTMDEIDNDAADGLCQTASNTCTLRAAVMQANVIGGPGVEIILPAGIYNLEIPIAGANGADTGDLNLTTPAPEIGNPIITITGAGQDLTIIDANQLDRVFFVDFQRSAIITGVTIRNGYLDPLSKGIGGGIDNMGTLTLSGSKVSGNRAYDGAGIVNFSTLNVSSSTISDNIAVELGGGLFNSDGTVNLQNSTINANMANRGGGVFNWANLFITNSTISHNKANRDGGGIANTDYGTSNVYNTTIVNNFADFDLNFDGGGGGVYNVDLNAVFNLRNTLVAGNFGWLTLPYDDCTGVLNSYGRNLIGINQDAASCTINTAFGSWGFRCKPRPRSSPLRLTARSIRWTTT